MIFKLQNQKEIDLTRFFWGSADIFLPHDGYKISGAFLMEIDYAAEKLSSNQKECKFFSYLADCFDLYNFMSSDLALPGDWLDSVVRINNNTVISNIKSAKMNARFILLVLYNFTYYKMGKYKFDFSPILFLIRCIFKANLNQFDWTAWLNVVDAYKKEPQNDFFRQFSFNYSHFVDINKSDFCLNRDEEIWVESKILQHKDTKSENILDLWNSIINLQTIANN